MQNSKEKSAQKTTPQNLKHFFKRRFIEDIDAKTISFV